MRFVLLEKGRFYGWIALLGTAVAFMFGNLYFMSFTIFMPVLCTQFGWSRAAVSLALMFMMIVMNLSGPLGGWFTFKYGPRKAIVIGNAIGAAGLLLLSFHSQLWQLYVIYGVCFGLGAGIGGMIASTTVASNWFVKKAPLAMGVMMSAQGIGGLVMFVPITEMVLHIGWRSTYLVLCGLIILFGMIIVGLLLRNKPEDLGQVPDGVPSTKTGNEATMSSTPKQYVTPVDFTVKEAVGTRALWILIIYAVTIMFIMTLVMAHQMAFLTDIGINAKTASILLALSSGLGVISTLSAGFLTLKLKLKTLGVISTIILLLSLIMAIFTRSLPTAIVYVILFGLGIGATFVILVSLVPAYFGRTHYAKLMGFNLIFCILGYTGAPLAGAIFDKTKSYTLAFAAAVAAAAVGVICMILVKPPVHPSLSSK